MLPDFEQMTKVVCISQTECGYIEGNNETFTLLELGSSMQFGLENTFCNELDDFGVHVCPLTEDIHSLSDLIGSNVLSVDKVENPAWIHTDDANAVHITVHTTSGSAMITLFHEHNVEDAMRKIIVKSPFMNLTHYI